MTTAYFCAEYALHDKIPIYSGGLGVLAGDHLKAASDLDLPLVAVGLRYQKGYFVQRIQADGTQKAEPAMYHPDSTPLIALDLRVPITLAGEEVEAKTWQLNVGQVPLYLLDHPAITDRLYPSDREPRLRQEILLGMGGWRILRGLNIAPDVCHLNEGHSAFLLVERLVELVESEGLSFAEAADRVRATTVFTTHTPVPAGHDRFDEGLMKRYFEPVAARLGISWEEFYALGHDGEGDEFSMTHLALGLAGKANGVSKLHGEVSRKMLDAPVDHITNGVHRDTWTGPEMKTLVHRDDFSDEELRAARMAQKRRMLEFVRGSVERMSKNRGESDEVLQQRFAGLDENALWIGFARRFAPYKRATLLFSDLERLTRILESADRPVRVVYSGKAHPRDTAGGELVKEVVGLADRFPGSVYFVEDYGIEAGRNLVAGCDVWLNTPTPPKEASGTSGMKACLNGGLHLSVLDGWWCEGYDGKNGWAIDADNTADHLYTLLENEVVPQFFSADGQWTAKVRRCLATVPKQFSAERMVSDYATRMYRVHAPANASSGHTTT